RTWRRPTGVSRAVIRMLPPVVIGQRPCGTTRRGYRDTLGRSLAATGWVGNPALPWSDVLLVLPGLFWQPGGTEKCPIPATRINVPKTEIVMQRKVSGPPLGGRTSG